MEIIKSLLIRLRHTGIMFLIGLIVIAYIALGFLYWQQGAEQEKNMGQIAKLNAILAKPLPSVVELQVEYEAVNLALAPMTDVDAIAMLVDIAEENGIDVDEASNKFRVPRAVVGNRVLSFNGISVQGDYDNVMAFISDLDSGKTRDNMVLESLTIEEVVVTFTGEVGSRRAEFRRVASAVLAMMTDNDLDEIPYPMNFAGGVAANLTGDDLSTEEIIEGFPDITTTAAEKGYSGNATVSAGYVLYNHDKISTDNTTQFKTVSYINTLTTKYYYTCETDGTVRQFDGSNVSTATEYATRAPSKIEVAASVSVAIYFKP
ncbi:hypothetical protein ACFLUR_00410 [Chloroflexota bacterium]